MTCRLLVMTTHAAPQKKLWCLLFTSVLLLALGACSSNPARTPNRSPPAATTADDTQKDSSDTAESPAIKSPGTESEVLPDTPAPDIGQGLGEEVALRAIALVGKPYHYGGADLHGFDCSGLVVYIYRELGIELPRSAVEQQRYVTKISRDELQPGDLVFFRINRKRISHVGIYVGDNRFVHAPQSGKQVVIRNLDDDYYARHWASSGRIN